MNQKKNQVSQMHIPLLDLKAQHKPIEKEILQTIEDVFRSNQFILGPQVLAFEENIANYCRTSCAVGVSSGTDALLIALMALEIGPGDEVITTPFSFFATAGSIARVGARPVFVDIDPITFNLDPNLLKNIISSKTKAIMPVHLYGQCADMDPIIAIAKEHNLKIIEDAAQAIGAEYKNGKRAGSMGDIGCFSFFPSKNLGGIGDGGMVTTKDEELAEKMRILRVHGSRPKYYHRFIGGNFRLDTIQAATLNVKLKHLDTWTKGRQKNAERYNVLFAAANIDSNLFHLPKAKYSSSGVDRYHIYNQYVIQTPRRDALQGQLTQAGVSTEIYYPVPFHLQECFKYLNYRRGDFPLSEKAAAETLALPIYPELTQSQQEYIVNAITDFYGGG